MGSRRAAHALAQLPRVQREAIVLHDIQGFTVDEIAAMQVATASAVKSRLSRGRERLRRFYLRRGWTDGVKGVAPLRSATGAGVPRLATSTGASPSGEEV
jgi:hypothetical protein